MRKNQDSKYKLLKLLETLEVKSAEGALFDLTMRDLLTALTPEYKWVDDAVSKSYVDKMATLTEDLGSILSKITFP